MAVIDNRTSNRDYALPHPDNDLSDDVLRLIAALEGIDTDVFEIFTSLTGKSNLGHGHPIEQIVGLTAALNSKSGINHTHLFDDLVGVSVATAASGQFLKFVGSTWQPATIAMGDVAGLSAALGGKADLQGTSVLIPAGTTAQRPSTPSGISLRWNTTLTLFEYWTGSAWTPLAVADVLSRSQNLADILDSEVAIANLGAAKADLSNTIGPRGRHAHAFTGDLNTLLENGTWLVSNTSTNRPPGTSTALLVRVEYGTIASNSATQYAREYSADSSSDSKLWKRERNSGTWGSWYRVRENEADLDTRYGRFFEKLASYTINNNTDVQITSVFDSSYARFLILLNDIDFNGETGYIGVQVGFGSPVTYLTSGYSYLNDVVGGSVEGSTAGAPSMPLIGTATNFMAHGDISGEIWCERVKAPNSGAMTLSWSMAYGRSTSGGPAQGRVSGMGRLPMGANIFSGLKLLSSLPTIFRGEVCVYGVK